MLKLFAMVSIVLLFCACDSLRRSNIAQYEKNLEFKEKSKLPPEPTLARRRLDEASNKSLMDNDGLNEKERAIVNKIKKEDARKARARSRKVFGVFAPKDSKR